MRSQFLSLLIGYILPLVTFLTKRPVQRRPGLPLSRGRALIREACLQMLRSPTWKALASAVQCVTQAAQTKARYGTRTRKPFIPLALASEPSYLYPWNHLTPLLTQDRPGSAVAAQWPEPPAHSGLWKEADGRFFFFFVARWPMDFAGRKWAEGGKSRDVIVRTRTTKPLLLLLWQGREDGAAGPAGRPGEGSNQLLHSPPPRTHPPPHDCDTARVRLSLFSQGSCCDHRVCECASFAPRPATQRSSLGGPSTRDNVWMPANAKWFLKWAGLASHAARTLYF